MKKTTSTKLLLFLIIGLVSTSLKGQSIKDFYIPLNYNKISFYQLNNKSGEKSGITKVIKYRNNNDGSYSIYNAFIFKGETTSEKIEKVIFTNNTVIRTKSSSVSLMGNKDVIYEPSQIILKMPIEGQIVKWTIPNEPGQTYTATWTTIIVEGESKKAIKVDYVVKDMTSKLVTYYVQGIGLMKTDIVNSEGKTKPFDIFDGLSNE